MLRAVAAVRQRTGEQPGLVEAVPDRELEAVVGSRHSQTAPELARRREAGGREMLLDLHRIGIEIEELPHARRDVHQ